MRQIVLDTETTGLSPKQGHRIIEIGCVELINRRLTGNNWHQYLQPDREIDAGAMNVHGITNEFLIDKPRFEDVVEEFIEFIGDAELVIHNAPFDTGFLNHELERLRAGWGKVSDRCGILDTLKLARDKHPGRKNDLDSLCKRYEINTERELHGALLDAEILAEVYLAMTGGQSSLLADAQEEGAENSAGRSLGKVQRDGLELVIIRANEQESEAHQQTLERLKKASGAESVWAQCENKT
ncbi:MAG: DNA polymerase III subunit epsilon [Gammaproteobacteria bacterium]|nr:DNA polymerase III subunit epsilon [Gammaproteobacteria bacterium]